MTILYPNNWNLKIILSIVRWKHARKKFKKFISTCQQNFQRDFGTLWKLMILGLYDFVTNIPKYENIKSAFCRERRQILGTLQNPADSAPNLLFCKHNFGIITY